jgi:hypothetical protein
MACRRHCGETLLERHGTISFDLSIYGVYTTDLGLGTNLAKKNTVGRVSADRRQDPAVRSKMSRPAMRALFNIAHAWQLENEEVRGLLGWPPQSTFYKYKTGQVGPLGYDTLMRISLVLGIYKALHILYAERDLADRWVKLPNSNPLFGGRPALSLMTEGGMDGLYQVRRLLDSRRGA